MELNEQGEQPERLCPPDHTEYLSQTVADNAATLHRFKFPNCTTIKAFPCGDHFHIGHASYGDKMRAHPELSQKDGDI